MNRILAFLLLCLCTPAFGQTSADGIGSKPELAKLVSDYMAQEKGVEDEIAPRLKAARDAYISELEEIAEKSEQRRRLERADVVRKELKRFQDRGLQSSPDKVALSEVRSGWTKFTRDTVAAEQSVSHQRRNIRAKFLQELGGLEQTYRGDKDERGLLLARQARVAVSIRNALESNQLAYSAVAGRNTNDWQDIAREGGYVVGFDVSKGSHYYKNVQGCLTPVFATAEGLRAGEARGHPKADKRVLAKEGYAVGGLMVRCSDVVNCVQIVFMRINADGLSLNPRDSYLSEWLGGEDGDRAQEISSRGRLIVGVTGTDASDGIVQSIGLIHTK